MLPISSYSRGLMKILGLQRSLQVGMSMLLVMSALMIGADQCVTPCETEVDCTGELPASSCENSSTHCRLKTWSWTCLASGCTATAFVDEQPGQCRPADDQHDAWWCDSLTCGDQQTCQTLFPPAETCLQDEALCKIIRTVGVCMEGFCTIRAIEPDRPFLSMTSTR